MSVENYLRDSLHGLDVLGGVASPSLVATGITQHFSPIEVCPGAGWLSGACIHGHVHWVRTTCKRRDCPVCGAHRRRKIAWRISQGVELLGGLAGGGWFVGSFDYDISKADAVKVQGKFVRWLRSYLGYKVEYAATWEVTRSGRLHLNLIMAPWRYISQRLLSEKWQRLGGGKIVWIERVGAGIGEEAAKSREKIGNYFAKWDQAVETGRGVAYSKGWPKLPDNPMVHRRGAISWRWVGDLIDEARMFWYERELGHWHEVRPGEWKSPGGESCDCFDYVDSS